MKEHNDGGRWTLRSYHPELKKLINPTMAICLAFFLAGLVVSISGDSPFEAYAALFKGAFGTVAGLNNTVRYVIPIILLGFSFSICQRSGYFNIGQEGQMYAAATTIVFLSTWTSGLPIAIRMTIMIICACFSAGIVTLIPALLKSVLGINEIIVAVMINYILSLFSSWTLLYSVIADKNASMPKSIGVPESIGITTLIIITIIAILVYYLALKFTTSGYRIRIIGKNTKFAKVCGLPTTKIILTAAFIAGIIVGLATVGEVMGVYHIVYDNFPTGMGFSGMTAALIGQHHPVGIVLGAIIIGALQSGSVLLSIDTNVPAEIVEVVKGFVMFFATVNLARYMKSGKVESGRIEV